MPTTHAPYWAARYLPGGAEPGPDVDYRLPRLEIEFSGGVVDSAVPKIVHAVEGCSVPRLPDRFTFGIEYIQSVGGPRKTVECHFPDIQVRRTGIESPLYKIGVLFALRYYHKCCPRPSDSVENRI